MNDRKANGDCLEREKKIKLSLITRFIIIVTIIVSIVDGIFLYLVKTRPEYMTIPFFILMVIVTVIPISSNIWWCLRKKI